MKRLSLYALALVATYLAAWTISYVVMFVTRGDGLDFTHFFEYLRLGWTFNGGELPSYIWLFSVILFLPLAGLVLWRLRKYETQRRSVEIIVDASGLRVVDSTKPGANPIAQTSWTDVTRVTAYKVDLFAHDRVCLLFESVNGQRVEVNEEFCGWESLLDMLPTALPGALDRDRVLGAVIPTAFATNETVVFSRR